jgi:hypothetical protein
VMLEVVAAHRQAVEEALSAGEHLVEVRAR